MLYRIAKNSLAPLKLNSLSSLQRLNHTLTETSGGTTQFYRHMASHSDSDSDSEPHFQRIIDMNNWTAVDAKLHGINSKMIPLAPWAVLSTLRQKGYQVYLVGGCVRDLLLHRIPKDFDVITTADLKQIRRHFNFAMIVGKRFPICHVHIKGSIIEVSSFNTEAQHDMIQDKTLPRMPSGCNVKDFMLWSNSIKRDFTINSLFYDPFSSKIYDYANGMADLKSLKLQTLTPAQVSFKEDCARILRGLRIAARLGLSVSKEIKKAIHNFSSSIKSLDKVNVGNELYAVIWSCNAFSLFAKEIQLTSNAAYLDQQAHKSYVTSNMLMYHSIWQKLFFHLDKLVSCDRPSDCNMWVGLLAFHMALVKNPQDELVLRAFASILYHGSWSEGVKTARKYVKGKVNFQPEVSGISDDKSDEELAKAVSHLASLVQVSLGALTEAKILAKLMSTTYPDFLCSPVLFVSNKKANQVFNIFNVIVEDIMSYENGRKNFTINYNLLLKGTPHEMRFVIGQILLQTMSDGRFFEEGKEYYKQDDSLASDMIEKSNPTHSGQGKSRTSVNNSRKRSVLSSNLEMKQNVAKRSSKVVEKEQGASKDLLLMIEKEFVEKSKEHKNESQTCQLPETSNQKEEGSQEKAGKHIKVSGKLTQHKPDDTVMNKQLKSKRLKEQAIEEENSKRPLSSIFRR
ncbi:hypothetical protein ACFE04_026578 [Oxalis oulophora]